MLKNLRLNPIAVAITCGTTALLCRSSDLILSLREREHGRNVCLRPKVLYGAVGEIE
jgi:hypothetical protein